MRRHFYLRDTNLKGFEDILKDSSRLMKDERYQKLNGAQRYVKIVKPVSYHSLRGLVDDSTDLVQKAMSIWFPDGDVSPDDAIDMTVEGDPRYKSKIFELGKKYDNLIVQLHKINGILNPDNVDTMVLKKREGLWVFDSFHIKKNNFSVYTLDGLSRRISNKTTALLGVYVNRN